MTHVDHPQPNGFKWRDAAQLALRLRPSTRSLAVVLHRMPTICRDPLGADMLSQYHASVAQELREERATHSFTRSLGFWRRRIVLQLEENGKRDLCTYQ